MTPGWISLAWPALSGIALACSALSLMAALLVPQQRRALFAFAVFTLSMAVFIVFELAILRAQTAEAVSLALRWSHLPLMTTLIAGIVFLRLHLDAGRTWLLYAAIGARLSTVAANFLSELNIHFLSITGIKSVVLFGGETVLVPVGVVNPWQALGNASVLLYFLFIVDATRTCWRRQGPDDRRRAVLVGGSFLFFVAAAVVNSQLILFGVIDSVYTLGVPFIAIAVAIMVEIGVGLLRARQLAVKLALSDADRRYHIHLLDQAARAAKLGTWVLDPASGKVITSKQARDLLGIRNDGPLNLEQLLAVLQPDEREAMNQEIARVLSSGGDFEAEHRLQLPDGRVRWIHSRGEAEVGVRGTQRTFAGIIFDVTELREAQEQSRLILEAAAFAIVGVDRDGMIVTVNRQAELLFGHSRAELLGAPLDLLIPERLRDLHREHVGDMFKPLSAATGIDREMVGRHADGHEIALQVQLSAIPTSDKLVLLASIIDLTERKRTELELEQQRSELSHLSRVTMMGELSGSLAHELNQPLAAILSNAQAALRFLDVEKPDLDEVREILRDIVSDDKRAGEVIRGLRLLLKRGEMRHEPVDINEVVLDVLRLLKSNTVNANVQVSTDLAPHLPLVTGDRVQLQQVVLNLVMNACDAMAGTTVALRRLTVTSDLVEGGEVRVCVADQGTGIAPELLERIFEPFVTTRAQGLGMGLSVCRQIVLAHRGRLWAFNNPGPGATVCLVLPARALGTS